MRTVVVSLGGSVMAPDGIDWEYLDAFTAFIAQHPDIRWIIVVGGGKTLRTILPHIKGDTQKDLVGIAVTRVNAQIVISKLRNVYPHVLTDLSLPEDSSVYVSGGFTPGRTTDDVAVQFALAHNADLLVNLTNVDGILVDGRVQSNMSSEQFFTLFDVHTPGMSAPFDPVAARRAFDHKQDVHIISGRHLERLESLLNAKPCIGTILSYTQ